MELKEAYQLLEVHEDATDEEIEKRYMIWVRRERANPSLSIEKVTEAYTIIRRYRDYGPEVEKNESFKAKAGHFFYYYKVHTFAVIAAMALLISIGFTMFTNYQEKQQLALLPDEQLEVMFYGAYLDPLASIDDGAVEAVEQNILTLMPEWERVSPILNYHTFQTDSMTDVGTQQRSAVLLATEQPDLYILDEASFQMYVGSGMFLPLDELDHELLETVDAGAHAYGVVENETKEQLFGLALPAHPMLDSVGTDEGVKQVAAIRRDAANQENALELLQKLIQAEIN